MALWRGSEVSISPGPSLADHPYGWSLPLYFVSSPPAERFSSLSTAGAGDTVALHSLTGRFLSQLVNLP